MTQSSNLHPEQVASVVASEFGVCGSVILSKPNRRNMSRRESYARHVYAYTCSRMFPHLSLHDISAIMKTCKSSVSRGVTKIAFDVERYASTKEAVNRIISFNYSNQ